MNKYDLVVIGAGPGGYVAAIRASQLGLKIAIIEKRATLGGTCLNVGCIPSKSLLESSFKFYEATKGLEEHGVIVDPVLDFKKLVQRKSNIVSSVTQGVDYLMKKNKIDRYLGTGSISSSKENLFIITIKGDEKSTSKELLNSIQADNVILATGSEPVSLPNITVDGKSIITSDHVFSLNKVPKKMLVIGGGVIGLELGSVWQRLGTDVSIVEFMPQVLLGADAQVAKTFQRILESQGLDIHLESKVLGVDKKGSTLSVQIENKRSGSFTIDTDLVLVAVGRKAYYEGLGIENLGVKIIERKKIDVNSTTFETSVKGIYAIGDVIDGPMLAHKAEEEGIAVAEIIAGHKAHVFYKGIPSVVYTHPELAWVGKTEEDLKKEGIAYKVGRSFFKGNARAKVLNQTDGFVKILADTETDTILGVHILGPNASEIIGEIAVAFEFGASCEDLARTTHAHPTVSEVIKEAAMDVENRAIHS